MKIKRSDYGYCGAAMIIDRVISFLSFIALLSTIGVFVLFLSGMILSGFIMILIEIIVLGLIFAGHFLANRLTRRAIIQRIENDYTFAVQYAFRNEQCIELCKELNAEFRTKYEILSNDPRADISLPPPVE